MQIDLVVGARPNLVKLRPVLRALEKRTEFEPRVVHTGQHYDAALNQVFFDELGLPQPAVDLGVGAGANSGLTGRILDSYERTLLENPPAAVVVFGDVNGTVACAFAAARRNIPVAHVEAGLRSFDRTMPEEVNRVLTDTVAGLLLVSEPAGIENLRAEDTRGKRIREVGNVMIDTLLDLLPAARQRRCAAALGLEPGRYGVVTLHRPSNVDDAATLTRLLQLLNDLARELPLVFPVHPRTVAAAERAGVVHLLGSEGGPVRRLAPRSYIDHLSLMQEAALVLTDSGGMQEESAVLGVPCLTLREATERPITIRLGTSRLVGSDPDRIRPAFAEVLAGRWPRGSAIPLWDGVAGERVAAELSAWLG